MSLTNPLGVLMLVEIGYIQEKSKEIHLEM